MRKLSMENVQTNQIWWEFDSDVILARRQVEVHALLYLLNIETERNVYFITQHISLSLTASIAHPILFILLFKSIII